MADRHAYLPFIGLYIAVARGLAKAVEGRREVRLVLSGVLAASVLVLARRSRWGRITPR